MFRGGVEPLERKGEIGGDAADIDERAASRPQMLGRHQRAVDRAPEIGADQALVIGLLYLAQGAIDRQSCDVDPRIDAPERRHSPFGQIFDIGAFPHIRHHGERIGAEFAGNVVEHVTAAGCEDHPGPSFCRSPCGRQTDAA